MAMRLHERLAMKRRWTSSFGLGLKEFPQNQRPLDQPLSVLVHREEVHQLVAEDGQQLGSSPTNGVPASMSGRSV